MVAGGHAWLPGGHVWLLGGCAWFQGGMHGCQGHAWLPGGMRGSGGVCMVGVRRIRRDTVNERAVRILLECILVLNVNFKEWKYDTRLR